MLVLAFFLSVWFVGCCCWLPFPSESGAGVFRPMRVTHFLGQLHPLAMGEQQDLHLERLGNPDEPLQARAAVAIPLVTGDRFREDPEPVPQRLLRQPALLAQGHQELTEPF